MLKRPHLEVVSTQIIPVNTVNFSIIDCMTMNVIVGLKLHE